MVRIAQVSPLYESVPPKLYGGTERVVSYLTEEVVASGHQVTLFASGDSETSASLVPITERSLRLNPHCIEAKGHTVRLVNPLLPHWLPSVRVSNLRIGNATVDLLLERHPYDLGVTVLRREGRVTAEVVK